jgi:hypothetical protein
MYTNFVNGLLKKFNRRRVMDMLLEEAKTRSSHQFIFFTPQEMNLKANQTITIHK